MIDATCEGCHFKFVDQCRKGPQQVIAPVSYDDEGAIDELWGFPPATHRCGAFQPDVSKCENVLDIANLVFRKRDPE